MYIETRRLNMGEGRGDVTLVRRLSKFVYTDYITDFKLPRLKSCNCYLVLEDDGDSICIFYAHMSAMCHVLFFKKR